MPIQKCPVSPEAFSQLINSVSKGEITDNIGRTVLEEMFKTGGSPDSIIDERGLTPIHDTNTLEMLLDEVMEENSQAASQINQGMAKPIDFLIGQVMRKTRGRANPKKARELLGKRLPHLS